MRNRLKVHFEHWLFCLMVQICSYIGYYASDHDSTHLLLRINQLVLLNQHRCRIENYLHIGRVKCGHLKQMLLRLYLMSL